MVKIIGSATHELNQARTKIEKLEATNINLTRRILILEFRLAKYEPIGPSDAASIRCQLNPETKRYHQPTVASQNRSVAPKRDPILPPSHQIVTIAGGQYIYDDGMLITKRSKANIPHYQQNTTSAWYKRRSKVGQRRIDDRNHQQADEDILDTGEYIEGPSSLDWDMPACEQGTEAESEMFDWMHSDHSLPPNVQMLKKGSGLHEASWLESHAGKVSIPSQAGLKLLSQALRLAQESFYNAARDNWPRVFRGNFIQGPHEVLFGHGELERYLGEFDFNREFLDIGGCSAADINSALFGVTELRNAVCHFGGRCWNSVARYDRLLADSQTLLVRLQDERRALKIRRLRDELREQAEKSLTEVEALGHLAVLPYPLPARPYHHKWLLESMDDCGQDDIHQYLTGN